MSSLDFSEKLRNEMKAAVMRGNPESLTDFVKTCTRDEAFDFFKDTKKLYKILEDIALNGNSTLFEHLLFRYKNDEDAMMAIVKGFKRDERYNNQPSFDERFGASKDYVDLERKRTALLKILKP